MVLLGICTILLVGISGRTEAMAGTNTTEKVTLGGGCFWCMEAMFEELRGVKTVTSGYAGGGKGDANYKEVCDGTTGHAEVIQITFDPVVTPLPEILLVFFTMHDPTTKDRQGADVGTQYRSVVFYENEAQKMATETMIAALTGDKVYGAPIVTEVAPLDRFYKAEDYHQDYYNQNKTQGYCMAVINPKMKKFREKFADKLK
jgi:methionine-S-sulfoxide reductase